MKGRIISLGLLVPFLFVGLLWAQSDRGTITGTVTDETGAVVPGVEVTAMNVDTGVATSATTNSVGLYTILNLPIGSYSVTFTKAGFKAYQRDGITVAIAQVVEVNGAMQVGAVTESVTVTAEAGILETAQTEVRTTMKSSIVTDLPLSISGGRALEDFAYAIIPAVEGNNWTSHIGGSQAFTKEVLIDGTSAVAQIGGHIGESSPAMEAVQEFTVETSGVRASDGRTGGGVFKFNLKSGTNDFHGSAFGFLRNEVLNANTWQNNNLGRERDSDRQTVYGFSAGGPIIKNKTFIFGTFEKYAQERLVLGQMNKTVPIPAFLDGDFSALLDTDTQLGTDAGGNPIYVGAIVDPQTGLVFPGNVIPSGRISSVSQNIVDIYRTSYQPMVPGALINNSAITRQNDPWFHQTQLTFKADHNFSPVNRLNGSLIWTERPRILVDQGGVWDPSDPNNTGGPFARSRKQEVTSRSLRMGHNYTFSPTLLNVAGVTYLRYRNPSLASATNTGNWPEILGLGDTGAKNFPSITFGNAVNGISTDRIGYSSSGYYVANTYIANDTLTWVKGRHTAKFGGEIRWMQINSHSGSGTLGFSFTNNQTGAPDQPFASQVGFGFASFLLGEAQSGSMGTPFDLYGRRKSYSLFVQDDWKVNSRLTLTLDLRWEGTGPFREEYGHWANFDKVAINPALGIPGVLDFAEGGSDSFETQRDWKQFAPHIGVAYQVANRVVLRAAYGMFYSPIGINYWGGVPYSFAPGFRGTNEVLANADLSPAFNWDNGYPGVFVPGTQDPTLNLWGPVHINPRSLYSGRSQQWTVGTEFELNKDTRLDFTYMGNRGSRLQSGDFERNQPDASALTRLIQSGNEWSWVWDEGSAAAAGVPYPYAGFSNFAFMALSPYPQVAETWGPLFHVGSPLGSSDYQSFQVALTKRTGRGLATQMSYNLSRTNTNMQNSLGGFQELWWAGPLQDVNKLDEEANTIAFYDQTHVFKGYAAWDLPFGNGRRFLANRGGALNALVGGWTLSTAFRYNTGFPLNVNSNNWNPGWDGPIYADVNTSGDFSRQFDSSAFDFSDTGAAPNRYFNPSLFSNPAWGEFGSGPMYLSQLRGFGRMYEDLGILKNFRFGADERFRVQVRFEFLNLFNRHYFADPDNGIGSPTFGQVINLTGSPREGQFGARFEW
jgi:hypothetical protein